MWRRHLSFVIVFAVIFALILSVWAQPPLRPRSLVLHSAETGNVNGNSIPVSGYGSLAVYNTRESSWDGTLNYEGTIDATNWVAISCKDLDTGAPVTTTASAENAVVCNVNGLAAFRARISGAATGSTTVTAVAVEQTTGGGSSNILAGSTGYVATFAVTGDCTGNANDGALTINSSDQIVCSDDDGGAGGGGDAVEIEQGDDTGVFDAADTTIRFEDQGDIDFQFSDGGAGGPDTVIGVVRANSVALGTDTTGNYAGSSSEGGAATTADALSADPSDCAADTKADSIAANGDLTCSAVDTGDITDDTVDFADVKQDNTLAGNPALLVDECYFVATATGGGFICEGSTADTNEMLMLFPDENEADTTRRIVLDSATQTLTNKTINTASNTITVVEADISDLAHTATAITDGLIIEPDLDADNAPTDGDILTYDSTGTNFAWVTKDAANTVAGIDGDSAFNSVFTRVQNLIVTNAGVPGAGTCNDERHMFVDTTNKEMYFCPDGSGGNPRLTHAGSDAYNQVSDGGSSASASGSETLQFTGNSPVTATVSAGSPDDVAFGIAADSIDFSHISNAGSIDEDTSFTAADGISLTLTPTHTSGDTNFFTLDANQTDDAAATDDFDVMRIEMVSESGDAGDTFEGLVISQEAGAADAVIDAAIRIENLENAASTMTDAIKIEATTADAIVDAIDVSDAEITNAINIGANPIVFSTGSLSATDLEILDSGDIDLAAEVTGTLPVGNGGTGATTLTDGGILLGSGSGAITALGVATNGQIPIGDGTTDPVLATITAVANETDVTNGAGTITIGIVTSPTLDGTNFSGIAAGAYAAASIDGDDIASGIAGDGLILTSASPDTLDVDLNATIDGVGSTSSLSGMEFTATAELALLQGCSDGQILKWVDAGATWDCAADADTGGSTAWDAIGDPSGDGTVLFAELDQDLTWDTGTTAAVFDGLTLNLIYDGTTDSGEQNLMRLAQNDGGNDATGTPDALLLIESVETTADDGPAAGIEIRATTAGTMPIAIDLTDAEIDTAIALGANSITTAGGTITQSELDILQDGSITTGEITDGTIIEPDLDADNAASDGDILTYDSTGTNFAWITPAAGTDVTADLEEEAQIAATAVTGNASASAVLLGTGANAASWDTTPAIDCTDCTNIPAAADLNDVGNVTLTTPGDGAVLCFTGTANASVDCTVGGDLTATEDTGTITYAVAANAVALTTDTTGNYVASITNGSGITGGDGGSEGAALTIAATLGTAIDTTEITDATIAQVDIDDTATLGGNPAFGDSSVWFGTTGLIFEGATSNTLEGLLISADITSTDKTWTLPDVTGTLLTGPGANGLVARTAAGTSVNRTLTASSTLDHTITNGDGVSGNPTIANARTITLAGNPALSASHAAFSTTGIIFEGATANTIEGLLTSADVATTDKTWTLPNETGTICTTGSVCSGYQASLGFTAANAATTITVAGTSNEITSSAGAQDLSTNRTWTLSLPASIDLGGKTSFEVPNGADPTTDAFGEIAADNDAWAASRGALEHFDGTASTFVVATLASDAPSNGQVPKWNTGGTITWENDSTGSGLGSNLSSTTDDILSDNGTILLGGTGNTNNEALDFDFETTANTVAVSSATGVTAVDFGTIDVATDALDVSEGNITNAGDVQLDSLTADDGTTITANDLILLTTSPGITSNTDVVIEVDADNNGSESFQVNDGAASTVFEVDETGSLILSDGGEASFTMTGDVSGTDTVITFGNGVVNVSTGTLQEAGSAVITAADTVTKSVYFSAGSFSSDGTNCADPAEVTINSGPKLYSVICTDNDSSRMHGSVVMPDGWDAGTVTFEAVYVQTAADTSALNMDVACQARGATETVNSTYGTEVAIDDAAVTGSNAVDNTTSAAVTCNCTTSCQAGDTLYWYLDIDATGTTTAVATLNFLGVKMEYGWTQSGD